MLAGHIKTALSDEVYFNHHFLGQASQWAYHPRIAKEETLLFDGFIKYDTRTGAGRHVAYGPGRIGGETVFVPREGAEEEDDGYVTTFVTDRSEMQSELVVYDAQSLELACRILLPRRVPFGFHANWVDHHPLAEAK